MKTAGLAALSLIKNSEGLRLNAYYCPAHKLTIGYGHLLPETLDNQKMVITEAQASAFLSRDVLSAVTAVNKLIAVELTQNQFDALVSFVFNLGAGALLSSTLRTLLNKKDYAGAADQFLNWNKAKVGGRLVALKGLTDRRRKERDLFLLA